MRYFVLRASISRGVSNEVIAGGCDEGGGHRPAFFLDRFFCNTAHCGFFTIYIPKPAPNQFNVSHASRTQHTGFRVNTTAGDLEPPWPVEIVPVTHKPPANESSKVDKTPRPTVTPINWGNTPLPEDAFLSVDPL